MDAPSLRSQVDIEAAVTETAARMVTHTVPGCLVAYEFGCWLGADDPGSVDPRDRKGSLRADFLDFVPMRARELVEGKIAHLAEVIDENDGSICVFRGMCVNRDWLDGDISTRPIGVCWAWDYDFAIAHRGEVAGGDPVEVRLVGLVESSDIDWTETVILAASELYVTGEEREVRLTPSAIVEIAAVDWRPDGADGKFVSAAHLETTGVTVGATWAATQPSKPLGMALA
ncbi:hypothetical protein OIU34_19510 [Pararhizobium sp. BT-229]|uniref:hypothetical protein n=1 Tax=Pararhizobium sp. BT-229 TaxID=2986923 RepID=UPI0021F70FF8|nr:hypothetical protein [Pararhizobium sp. BT-229]MCV9964072.1 hypothetical protein [Pararhizobium sp. BT-229]